MVGRVPTPPSCTCLVCHPDPQYADSATVEAVGRFGWSALWVAGSFDFAYTVGVYHTFGQPELVMFGLQGEDMPSWLNAAVELGRDKGWPEPDQPFDGVLDGFDTQVRDVHPSWYRALFGTALSFYRGVGVPFRQLIWPDRHGHWPWDDEATPSSRARQAFSWLPVSQNPEGAWRLVGELGPTFPFPAGPDAWVLTSRSVLAGTRPVARVAHDQGSYDVLDERGHEADDLCLAFLGDLVRQHPQLRECVDLIDGQVATASVGADGRTVSGWTRTYLTAADRRTSKRAWTLAQPS
jgi:Domain of unknown function (DUF4262)